MKRLLAAIALAMSLVLPAAAQVPAKPDVIEVLEITGEITRGTASFVAAQVEKINETPKVKAVLLVVNSPGGGVQASDVVYQELAKIKVPVVGYCVYMCASGGTYILMSPSVKYIAVRDEAIGGSVGVIVQLTRFNRLLDWAKIDNETLTSGPLKDAGNPTRAGRPTDTAYFQEIVDTMAGNFYRIVQKARPKAKMDEIKTARIFIGKDIVRVGLADAVMSMEEAVAKAKQLSGSTRAFTRDELRKITKDASEAAGMGGHYSMPDRLLNHLDYGMELLKEVRAGESVRFEYRMPYQF